MKFKRLIPALAMLLVSAILLGTSTFAWFSMNTEVSATDMRVRAVAEQGLLINEVQAADSSTWDNEATAAQKAAGETAAATDPSKLYPASTANGTTWYHAASKKSNSAAAAAANAESGDLVKAADAATGYETLPTLNAITAQSVAASQGVTAKRETMGKTANDAAGYYVHYEYYLKSSSAQLNLRNTTSGDKYIAIKSVKATASTNSGSGSTELNKSLRVGIKLNSAFYIYAPVAGYTDEYYVAAGSTATEPIDGATATATDLALLPASNAAGAKVDVYIWYEGEDAGCKTDNATAATLDDIDVDIVFSLETVA